MDTMTPMTKDLLVVPEPNILVALNKLENLIFRIKQIETELAYLKGA